jgi:hypothetical protein
MQFTGQLSFDWIRGSDGQCAVLECNPRATSGLHLFDLTAEIPNAFEGVHNNFLLLGNSRPRMIAALMLTSGLAQSVRMGRLKQWRHDFSQASDVIGIAADRRPLLGVVTDLFDYSRDARKHGRTLRESATRDIEWDGQPIDAES